MGNWVRERAGIPDFKHAALGRTDWLQTLQTPTRCRVAVRSSGEDRCLRDLVALAQLLRGHRVDPVLREEMLDLAGRAAGL